MLVYSYFFSIKLIGVKLGDTMAVKFVVVVVFGSVVGLLVLIERGV